MSLSWLDQKNRTVYEKASDRKPCPWCDTGVLHTHVTLVDQGMSQFLRTLGEFKEDPEWLKDGE